MKIIDAHSHWLPQEIINNAHFFNKSWGDIEVQLKIMDSLGIQKAVLSYPTSDAHLKLGSLGEVAKIYNNNVSQIIKKYPERFVGAAILPVGNKDQMLDELKRATQELGLKAISIGSSYNGIYPALSNEKNTLELRKGGVYLDDTQFLSIYIKAQQENLPIFVHSQIINPIGFERVKDPLLTPVIEYIFDTTICIGKLLMADIFKNYPNLKFIFAYFGGVTPFIKHRYDATYQMLRGINFVKDLGDLPSKFLKQIYVDTSGDTTLANFLSSLELFGASHILWGSDYPAKKDIKGSIEIIDKLNLTQEEKENILGGNLEEMLKGE